MQIFDQHNLLNSFFANEYDNGAFPLKPPAIEPITIIFVKCLLFFKYLKVIFYYVRC